MLVEGVLEPDGVEEGEMDGVGVEDRVEVPDAVTDDVGDTRPLSHVDVQRTVRTRWPLYSATTTVVTPPTVCAASPTGL